MWDLIKGQVPILLVASHSYSQIRDGHFKPGDIGTGQLVRKLAKSTACWAFVSTKIQNDPNWYSNSPFRKEIDSLLKKEKIVAVIDIHGRKNPDNLIEYYPDEYFLTKFSSLLKDGKVKNFINNNQITIVEHLSDLKLPGLEVEISRDGRTGQQAGKVFDILKTLIFNMNI